MWPRRLQIIGRRLKPRSARALPAVLRLLAEQLRLQSEDVVEDPVDAPPFESMVCDHPGMLEVMAQRRAERSVNARASTRLGLLEQLETPVERKLAEPVLGQGHVPSSSTLPSALTRDMTTS